MAAAAHAVVVCLATLRSVAGLVPNAAETRPKGAPVCDRQFHQSETGAT